MVVIIYRSQCVKMARNDESGYKILVVGIWAYQIIVSLYMHMFCPHTIWTSSMLGSCNKTPYFYLRQNIQNIHTVIFYHTIYPQNSGKWLVTRDRAPAHNVKKYINTVWLESGTVRFQYIAVYFLLITETPIARPLRRGMGVFREIIVWPKFYFRIWCAACGIELYGTAIYRQSLVYIKH